MKVILVLALVACLGVCAYGLTPEEAQQNADFFELALKVRVLFHVWIYDALFVG